MTTEGLSHGAVQPPGYRVFGWARVL